MVPYLYFLMAIIGIAFFIVLLMIIDAVFNEFEAGTTARRVYETPKKTPIRNDSRGTDAGAA